MGKIGMSAILGILFFSSLAGIVFLVRRKLPAAHAALEARGAALDRTPASSRIGPAMGAHAAHIGGFALQLVEKILRRLKILALKFDNISARWIMTLRRLSRGLGIRHLEWRTRRSRLHLSFDTSFLREIERFFEGFLARYFRKEGQEATRVREDLDPKERELVSHILKNPKNVEAYRNLGLFYFDRDNYRDALSAFEAMKKLDPSNIEAADRLRHIKKIMAGSTTTNDR